MTSDQGREPASGEPEALAPLPRGRHFLPAEEVERHQRERILNAVARGMARRGYAALTVGSIIAEARVSRTTFYEQFENKQEAVLGAHQEIFRRFLTQIEVVCANEEEWPMKLRRGLEAAVDFAVAEPAMALLLSSQAEVADRAVGKTMLATRRRLVELLRNGREQPGAPPLPEITEEALVGAISTVLTRAVVDGDLDDAQELSAQLVTFALVFY
jgi:AcrR family transcriptional regulator